MNYCKRDLGFYKSGRPIIEGNDLIIPLVLCVDKLLKGDKFSFCIPCNFDYPQTIGNVIIEINGVVNLFAFKNGTIKTDQLCKRKVYYVEVDTEFMLANICNPLPCSKFTYPVIDLENTRGNNKKTTSPTIPNDKDK